MSNAEPFENINNIKLHCFDNLYRQYAEKHPTYLQNSKTLDIDNGYPLQFYIMNTGTGANSSQII